MPGTIGAVIPAARHQIQEAQEHRRVEEEVGDGAVGARHPACASGCRGRSSASAPAGAPRGRPPRRSRTVPRASGRRPGPPRTDNPLHAESIGFRQAADRRARATMWRTPASQYCRATSSTPAAWHPRRSGAPPAPGRSPARCGRPWRACAAACCLPLHRSPRQSGSPTAPAGGCRSTTAAPTHPSWVGRTRTTAMAAGGAAPRVGSAAKRGPVSQRSSVGEGERHRTARAWGRLFPRFAAWRKAQLPGA